MPKSISTNIYFFKNHVAFLKLSSGRSTSSPRRDVLKNITSRATADWQEAEGSNLWTPIPQLSIISSKQTGSDSCHRYRNTYDIAGFINRRQILNDCRGDW